MATINTFITDRVLRFNMMNQGDTSEIMWSLTQVTDPSLAFASESNEITDAIGNVVANIDRAKTAEFSGSNAFFDLSLFAAQQGAEKEIATSSNKITTPCFEIVKAVEDPANPGKALATVDLAHVAKDITAVKAIYALNGDDTLSTKYAQNTAASATEFAISTSAAATPVTSIALPLTDAANSLPTIGDEYFVQYEYEMEDGVAVTAKATEFPKAGYGIMEVLGYDICNQTDKIYAYYIFPNAKLLADADLNFSSDNQNHPFTIQCRQQYCDREKILVKLVIPE